MYPEVYKEWIKLFKDDFVQVWQDERKEMQKVALLLCALQNELKNVQTNVEVEVANLRQQLKCKDDLESRFKSPSFIEMIKSSANKENEANSSIRINRNEEASPDIFKNIDLNACPSTNIIDLSMSDDDVVKIDGSPTIKKRRKRHRVPNFTPASILPQKNNAAVNTVQESVKTNLFKKYDQKSSHDISVIECTPEPINRKSKTASKISSFLSKNKVKANKQQNTLTQMIKTPSVKISNATDDGSDSDVTYFDGGKGEGTKMGITDLIDYISNGEGDQQPDTICQDMETSTQEVDQFSKGAIFNEEDIETNENPKTRSVLVEPVVRGNARKQLRGWSCQQCKNFYSDLPPEQMQKKMDECSRHRYKYNPPEETMPGFWNLSIPPDPKD